MRNINYQTDLCVVGGGMAGLTAAVSAAREGAKVLLVEKNGFLGGVGTAGLVNHLLGARLILDNKIYQSVSTAREMSLADTIGSLFRGTLCLYSTKSSARIRRKNPARPCTMHGAFFRR